MKRKSRLLLVLGTVFCCLWLVRPTLAVEPSSKILTDISASELVKILKELGIEPTVSIDSDGDPLIKIPLGGRVDSVTSVFFFYDKINKDRYADLQLSAIFRFSPKMTESELFSKANEFNRRKRLCAAYIDKDGDVVLQSDLALTGGVTEKSIKVFIENFESRFFDLVSIMQR